MNKEIKIVTIGGGSSYTPELAEGFIKRSKTLNIKEWWLVDIDDGAGSEKLNIIHALVERMFKKAGLKTKIFKTLDRREALKNADFVTTQLRVGGLKARELDERIPLEHKMIGQETNGAGGLFKGLRTIPVIFDIIKDTKELAPDAFIINFTNPVGIVTQAVAQYNMFDKFIGVCNVPINTRMAVANKYKVSHKEVKYNVVGLNHFVYFTNFWVNDKDITNEILEIGKDPKALNDMYPANVKATVFDPNLIDALKALPCGYHRYYYNRGTILKEYLEQFKSNTTRAENVIKLEKSLFEKYQDLSLNVKPKELEKRGGAHYADVACEVINSIHNDTGYEMVVSAVNNGRVENWPDQLVIEATSKITKNGALPVENRKINIPDLAMASVKEIKQFEMLAAEAAVEGSYTKGLAALQLNPLSEDSLVSRNVFDKLLEAHKKYLPQFKITT